MHHDADGIFSSQPLGAVYSPEKTTFRVWAPTATQVTLHLYQSPTGGKAELIAPVKGDDGAWETTIQGDLKGCYYTYTAAGEDPRFNPHRELLDPYAMCVTAPGGRAIVVHDETPIADHPDFHKSNAVIYELHIRDFTIDPDSGIQRRGKYLGLIESGAHLTGRKDIYTGIDHISELGINVVQLMPVSEFYNNKSEDQYGWGYDVVHHNSPEGWYATERFDARRVGEFKRLIDAFHRRGIRVTLDVVFNHTFEAIFQNRVFSFEGLVPGYYYRLKPDGSYWNGSGTGNEFRTEAPMVRRYILDTLKMWVTEYKVDGFRFDLLGLMDRETLRVIAEELRALVPGILLYGEPWAGGSTPIDISHKGSQRSIGWSVFNDHYRDALKGNVFHARDPGFVQYGAHSIGVRLGICGGIDDFADTPLESINYVECHDNHTLWDKLVISTIDDARITDADRRDMNKLAAVALFTSQGIPFIESGQEFLRTKGGDHNSYNKPDSLNMIRWREKAAQFDVFKYYQGLIALRKAHPLFRLESGEQVRESISFLDEIHSLRAQSGFIGFIIEDLAGKDTWSRAIILLNSNSRTIAIDLPPGEWQVFGDGREISLSPIQMIHGMIEEGAASVPPRSALILGETRK